MGLKRILVLLLLAIALSHATAGNVAMAQETGPLVMRAEFEWTLVGVVGGVAVGALIWLTDPAAPGNSFSDSIAAGAAWGAILGAGFGIFILQRATVLPPPTAAVHDPLDPRARISADPVADLSGQSYLLAHRDAAQPLPGELRLPLLHLQF